MSDRRAGKYRRGLLPPRTRAVARGSPAGGALPAFEVEGLDEILARLAVHGIGHDPEQVYDNGVRHVVVSAPDGNSLSLAVASVT
ncbi:hypothetical protein [Nocardiopsis sp. M1B1]|uniref:hypothetical protein n=1 Tax=Nocardiopsis sp. M1B1 TaxID=3450454 RepID=UPI0040398086